MIGVMSDSHDNLNAIRWAVRVFRNSECSLVIHAGDIIAPFAARELADLGYRVKAVFGNCDGEKVGLAKAIEPFGEIQEAPYLFNYQGLRILISHLDAPLVSYLASQEYDLVVYGHTHKPDVRRDRRTLALNPGETGGWLTGKSTVALFNPETREPTIFTL